MNQVVITIARQYGSGGRTVGKMLAERLGISFYDKQIIQMASDESGIDVKLFGKVETSEMSTAAGRPMASAMRLERRSSASSMPKSLRRCIPSMRYTPNSCRRRAS